MSAELCTKSEGLFEELCQRDKVPYVRLKALDHKQQPDYEITPGGQLVVVEIKQIEPNNHDLQYAYALKTTGRAEQLRNPDEVAQRLRKHIRESRSQFRSYLKGRPVTPSLLVVFDNANNKYTHPDVIQTALHGSERVELLLRKGHDPIVADRGFGPRNNRTLRPGLNEHLSAVAALDECWLGEIGEPRQRVLGLRIFHNPYATVPLPLGLWSNPYVRHYTLSQKVPGQYQHWVTLQS